MRGVDKKFKFPRPAKTDAKRPPADNLICNDEGVPMPILANALTMLRSDSAIAECVALDEMAQAAMVTRRLPNGSEWQKIRPLTDGDVGTVQEYMQHKGLARLSKDTTHQAVDMRAEERRFHPVGDYLNSLKVDARPRVGTGRQPISALHRRRTTMLSGRCS